MALNCFAAFGQNQKVFPAEKNKLWGFINEKGEWLKEPGFIASINSNYNKFYFMVHQDSRKLDLWIYDVYGNLVKQLPDTIEVRYSSDGNYDLKRPGYSIYDLENELLYSKKYADSVLSERNEIWATSYWQSDYNNPETDSIIPLGHDNLFEVWYQYRRLKHLGGIEPVAKKLLLVNEGGYSLSKFHEGYHYKSGCVVEIGFAHYETLKITGGKWGVIDRDGNFILKPGMDDLSCFQMYYPSGHPANTERREHHLAFITAIDKEKTGRKRHITIINSKGKIVFKDILTDSLYCKAEERHNFYTLSYIRNNKTIKAITLDYNGNVTDTFQNINCNSTLKLCAVQKDNKWGIMDYRHEMVTPFLLVSNNNCFPAGKHSVCYSNSDTTLIIVNLANNSDVLLHTQKILDQKGGYYIGESYNKTLHTMQYGLFNSQGKLLFTNNNCIQFSDTNYYTGTKNYLDIAGGILTSGVLINKRQSVPNAFTVEGFYINSYQCLLDSSFNVLPISSGAIYDSENDFEVISNPYNGYSSKDYRLFYKKRPVTYWLESGFSLYPMQSVKFQLFYYGDYLLYVSGKNCFLSFDNYNIFRKPDDYGTLMRIEYIEKNGNKRGWVYIDSRGKVIYNSNPSEHFKATKVSWKKLKTSRMRGEKSNW